MAIDSLSSLRLFQFRCFRELALDLPSGFTFFIGANAMGKTSLLESVCMLTRLQSPRTSTPAELATHGSGSFSIDGRTPEAHLGLRWENGTRRLSLDSRPQTRTEDYLAAARVAWFGNLDAELVRGSGGVRRRYLDFLGIQCLAGYRAALRDYERALRSRNALLKDGRPAREVAAFDEPLVRNGEALIVFRTHLCEALAPLVAAACHEISGATDEISLCYRPSASPPLVDALAASAETERRLRVTSVGPHRDDVDLLLRGAPAAAFASEGQQRSLALALKLAQARHLAATTGNVPIHLVDDVFGELDPRRRASLLGALPAGAQVLITTTSLDWLPSGLDARVFHVANGQVSVGKSAADSLE